MGVDADFSAAMATAGLGTVGTDIYYGGELPYSATVPAICKFVLLRGGPPPIPLISQNDIYTFDIQVIVRGERVLKNGAWTAAQTAARAVISNMHRASISGYFSCVAINSEPIDIGLDDQEMPRFSCNFRLQKVVS